MNTQPASPPDTWRALIDTNGANHRVLHAGHERGAYDGNHLAVVSIDVRSLEYALFITEYLLPQAPETLEISVGVSDLEREVARLKFTYSGVVGFFAQ